MATSEKDCPATLPADVASASLPTAPTVEEDSGRGHVATATAGSADSVALIVARSPHERYVIGSLLGAGGAGAVYRAHDKQLDRPVALKFLRGDARRKTAQFLNEARAQARVGHPNVCKVYEVGLLGRDPFIAMQLIEGTTLHDLAADTPRERRVELLATVADAVHAAHKTGLIHRDLKPANVMVVEAEDGRLVPYVMDFGLAFSLADAGSKAGIAGTPEYMAPEQARGDTHDIDRRTDVWGLGATLYATLAGEPPYDGETPLDVVVRIAKNEEPTPLRALVPSIPLDLASIVEKCMASLPPRRYDSARALAEDLRRYLDGQPVRARTMSRWERAARAIRRHKALAIIATAAAILVGVFATLGVVAEYRSSKRAKAAQWFGAEVQRIEGLLRIAHTVPLHDVRREEELVRGRMARVRERMVDLDDAGRALGNDALGRGHLALGEYDAAKDALDRAWADGDHNADLSFSLGVTLGKLHLRELERASRIADPALREQVRARAELEYRLPAEQHLRTCTATERASPAYLAALVAFYDGRDDEALARARDAIAQEPWLYESLALAGEVYGARADAKRDRGDTAGAASDYDAAIEALRAAARIGESDPEVYEASCRVWIDRARMDLYGRGAGVEEDVARAVVACEDATRADPSRAGPLAKLSRAHRYAGEFRALHGRDPLDAIERAADAARRAIALDGALPEASLNLASAYRLRAATEIAHGQDPSRALGEGFASVEVALRASPTDTSIRALAALLHVDAASWAADRGGDARPQIQAALAELATGLEANASAPSLHNNRGLALLVLARSAWKRGEPARDALVEALAACDRASGLNAKLAYPRLLAGSAHLLLAEIEGAGGGDPGPLLARALDAESAALAVDPELAVAHAEVGAIHLAAARFAHAGERSAEIRLARDALARAIEIDPAAYTPYFRASALALRMAETWLLAAEDGASAGQIETALANAEPWIDAAAERDRQDPLIEGARARLQRLRADAARRTRSAPRQ